jgi:hypothetical protein
MRGYIFTENERRRLKKWLETEEEDITTRMLFVQVRRNLNQLRRDLTLLSKVAKELSRQDRFAGRAALPDRLRSVSQRVEFESNLRRRGRST